jgi:hypothetical protein
MSRQLVLEDDLYTVVEAIERQTGLSEIDVVRAALNEKLERVQREREAAFRLKELKTILQRLTPLPGQSTYMTNEEFDAWMYDEHGLPH